MICCYLGFLFTISLQDKFIYAFMQLLCPMGMNDLWVITAKIYIYIFTHF